MREVTILIFPDGQVILDGKVKILEVDGFKAGACETECVGESAPEDNNDYTITHCYELTKEVK